MSSRYNWSPGMIDDSITAAQSTSGMYYYPMIWGEQDLDPQRLANLSPLEGQTPTLLGFNEPNFQAQVRVCPVGDERRSSRQSPCRAQGDPLSPLAVPR